MLTIVLAFTWFASIQYMGGYNPTLLWIALTGLLATPWIIRAGESKVRGVIWASSPFDIAAIVLFIAVALSYALSLMPGISLDPALTIASLPLTYFVSRHALSKSCSWQELQRPLQVMGGVVVLLSVVEFFAKQNRPFATFGDFNALASFFNILLIPLYTAVLADWQAGCSLRQQKTRLSAIAALAFAVSTTTSLGGQLCLAGGLGLVTILAGPKNKKTWQMLALLMLVLAPAYIFTNSIAKGHEAASRLATLNEQQSFTERVDMIKSALAIYQQGPWYGSGIGMYKTLYPAQRSVTERSTTGDLAHDDYVQFLTEGGPALLGSLLLIAILTARRLWTLWRRLGSESTGRGELLKTAGYAIAVSCLLAHAAMNFIFYILPLSMVAGLYLARVESAETATAETRQTLERPSQAVFIVTGALMLFLVATLGIRTAFVALSSDACGLHGCTQLRNEGTLGLRLANVIAVTQPTWLPARDHIVARLRQEAASASDLRTKERNLQAAALELAGIIKDAPAVFYPYATLAEMIEAEPSLASLLPPGIPKTAAELYRLALVRYPQSQGVRLRLAKALETDGKHREAFDLVNEDGMRWWLTALVPDTDRVAMLRFMIPRAIGFGLCNDARSMAGSLSIFVPGSALAKQVSTDIEEAAPNIAGCGIAARLPVE